MREALDRANTPYQSASPYIRDQYKGELTRQSSSRLRPTDKVASTPRTRRHKLHSALTTSAIEQRTTCQHDSPVSVTAFPHLTLPLNPAPLAADETPTRTRDRRAMLIMTMTTMKAITHQTTAWTTTSFVRHDIVVRVTWTRPRGIRRVTMRMPVLFMEAGVVLLRAGICGGFSESAMRSACPSGWSGRSG